ncbi:serine/threonine protein phosphatase [Nocardia takedensis]|uniref:serine/threonine protein phosphatase n=1 Tax=Nocardia takedensis TaxID=259390 RepID=UPI0002F38C68|nr:serine/threonine protein phosphatase [Nocardia takedensis]
MTIDRIDRHRRLTTVLGSHSDIRIAELIEQARPNSVGVGGGTAIAEVGGTSVFVKRIPLTDRELAHPGSTANLFELPLFCHYGVGGPSFNAWRELAANVEVTESVLRGATRAFPMLHHWRVLPGRAPIADDHADIEAVVAANDGHPAVRVRLAASAAASWSLVLFSEYVPRSIVEWSRVDPRGKAGTVERQFSQIVTFLRERELLHMDAHFGNLRVEGDDIRLADFGLATSPRFELSPDERDFVRRHVTHDADYAAMRLVNWLVTEVCGVPMPEVGGPVERNEYVARCAAGDVPQDVSPEVAAILRRHAPAAARMNAFYWKLFDGEVHTPYPGP